jgi:hypothetical protein
MSKRFCSIQINRFLKLTAKNVGDWQKFIRRDRNRPDEKDDNATTGASCASRRAVRRAD